MENELLEIIEEEIKEEKVKPYTLRTLKAEDTFKVLAIFKKIGLKKFTTMLQNEQVQNVIKKIRNKESKDIENEQLFNVGSLVFEIGDVLLDGLANCEREVFILLESVSNLSIDEIKDLEIADFLGMIIDVILENKSFLKAVSKYFK